jgi:hypothetical protein
MSDLTETQKTNKHADRMKRLRDKANRSKQYAEEGYPDAVDWDERGEGTIIMGKIHDIGEPITTEFGDSVPVQIDNEIEGSDAVETVTVWISPLVLRKKWEKNRPLEGDTVAIVYLGEQETKSGSRSYKNFDVHLERAPGNLQRAIEKEKELRQIREAEDAEEFEEDDDLPF